MSCYFLQHAGCMCYGISVRHTPVLCQNEGTHRGAVFTFGWPPVSRMVDGRRPCPGKMWAQREWPPVKTAEQYTLYFIAPKP